MVIKLLLTNLKFVFVIFIVEMRPPANATKVLVKSFVM